MIVWRIICTKSMKDSFKWTWNIPSQSTNWWKTTHHKWECQEPKFLVSKLSTIALNPNFTSFPGRNNFSLRNMIWQPIQEKLIILHFLVTSSGKSNPTSKLKSITRFPSKQWKNCIYVMVEDPDSIENSSKGTWISNHTLWIHIDSNIQSKMGLHTWLKKKLTGFLPSKW